MWFSPLWIIAAVVVSLACGPDVSVSERTRPEVAPSEAGAIASGGASETEPAVDAHAPEPAIQKAEVEPALVVQPHSLERLLSLPSVLELPESPPRPDITGDPTDPLERRGEHRVRLDFGTNKERSVVPGTERIETDLGVSLGVSERTRLRAGVRLEREGDAQEQNAMPTLGIERRF